LTFQLVLNLGSAVQLRVQSFAHVVELIFDHGENIRWCHRGTGCHAGTALAKRPTTLMLYVGRQGKTRDRRSANPGLTAL
jgi:hypothetical protein